MSKEKKTSIHEFLQVLVYYFIALKTFPAGLTRKSQRVIDILVLKIEVVLSGERETIELVGSRELKSG